MCESGSANKVDIKTVMVMLWEVLGVCSIVLLLYLPNGNTVASNLFMALDIQMGDWNGIGYENLVLIGIFLVIYFTSFKLLGKYRSTKMFSLATSFLMVITLVTAIVFAG